MSALLPALRRRPVLLRLAAVVSLSVMFGAGVLVARATMGPDTVAKSHAMPGGPNAAAAEPAIGRVIGSGQDSGSGSGGSSGSGTAPGFAGSSGIATPIAPYGGCGAPITPAVSGGAVDPTKMGFVPNMLGAGFTLTGVGFASQGRCGKDGQAEAPHLTMTSQWLYGQGGPTVSVTQTEGADPVANVVMPGNASFTFGDSTYSIWASSFVGGPVPVSDGGPVPADSTSGQGATIAKSGPNMPPTDPKIAEAINAAIAQLAPGLQQCFYRQVDGGWGDLEKLGIGDPRGAIPTGFSQQSVYVSYFNSPDASCPKSAVPFDGQGNFNANFTSDAGFLQMNAYSAPAATSAGSPPQSAQRGRSGDSFASWTNGSLYFNVSGSGPAVTRGVITAVATALDPNFAKACMVATKPMTSTEVGATGVHTPQAPDGYRLDNSTFTANQSTGDCAGSAPSATGFALSWMFVSDHGSLIQASAQRGTVDGSGGPVMIADDSLLWSDDNGVEYSVTGLKLAVPRDILLAVAKSMDPSFSESRLLPPSSGAGTSTNPSGPASSPPSMPVYN